MGRKLVCTCWKAQLVSLVSHEEAFPSTPEGAILHVLCWTDYLRVLAFYTGTSSGTLARVVHRKGSLEGIVSQLYAENSQRFSSDLFCLFTFFHWKGIWKTPIYFTTFYHTLSSESAPCKADPCLFSNIMTLKSLSPILPLNPFICIYTSF